MDKFIKNGSRATGLFFVIMGVLVVEKYLDTMKVAEFNLKPVIAIFIGLLIYFYNRD